MRLEPIDLDPIMLDPNRLYFDAISYQGILARQDTIKDKNYRKILCLCQNRERFIRDTCNNKKLVLKDSLFIRAVFYLMLVSYPKRMPIGALNVCSYIPATGNWQTDLTIAESIVATYDSLTEKEQKRLYPKVTSKNILDLADAMPMIKDKLNDQNYRERNSNFKTTNAANYQPEPSAFSWEAYKEQTFERVHGKMPTIPSRKLLKS